jgi:glycine C-acetyltransferase
MYGTTAQRHYAKALADIREAGTWKDERLIESPQGAEIVVNGKRVLNFCANNYLGLSDHPRVVEAARRGLDERGYGMSSVRFICGTQDRHRALERRLAEFVGTEDCILFPSAFDANGGVFEALLGEDDAVVSDALNHASIIDGIRLCKAERQRYAHGDMSELELCLVATRARRLRLIVTDGVFSMDGDVAKLPEICGLAERYDAMVMVDDSHATGFMGANGRGTHEFTGMASRVDLITSTLGKALGGASGGFAAGPRDIVELLRQRARPYLFSNSVSPVIVAGTLEVLDLLSETAELRERLMSNAKRFRDGVTKAGFRIKPGEHPIVPIMIGDARAANEMARDLLAEGIYVIGFSYPVVPKGQARIRVQLSAAHSREHVDRAVDAFARVGKRHDLFAA